MDDDIRIVVTKPVRDEGSIIVFQGLTERGTEVLFAVDHRPAQILLDALEADDGDEGAVVASVAPWQIIAGAALTLVDPS